MKRVLLIDDQSKDLAAATGAAQSLGFEDIQTRSSVTTARAHLEKALNGEVPFPDAIVLDLDLGIDSGFELLRFWHSTPELSSIPMIVWSVVEDQRNICELFNVNCFVSKWQGRGALREALAQLVC